MRELTPDQEKFIEKTRLACERAAELAAEADRLNLPILAREWHYLGSELEKRVDLQLRAFRNGTLAVVEPKEEENKEPES